jgi:hypothetical protein
MPARNIHTVRRGKRWVNVRSGSKRVTSSHWTQAAAINRARKIAKKNRVEHIIHRRSGRIRAGTSYGNDPHPPKG